MNIKPLFREFPKLAVKLVREQLIPLAIVFTLGCLLTIRVEDAMKSLSPSTADSRWMLQLTLGLWDLFEGILLMLILSWGIPKVRSLHHPHLLRQPFTEPYLNSFLAEYLRVLAQVLLYALLFIIPGFIRYMRLLFVPYIALFVKPYRAGEIDALALSHELTAGRLGVVFGALVLSSILQLAVEFVPHLVPSLHILPLRVLFMLASSLIAIATYSFFYLLFEQAMEDKKWT